MVHNHGIAKARLPFMVAAATAGAGMTMVAVGVTAALSPWEWLPYAVGAFGALYTAAFLTIVHRMLARDEAR